MGKAQKSVDPQYHFIDNDAPNEQNDSTAVSQRQRKPVRFFWFWEFIATTASCACMVAVTIILGKMQSQPLQRWNISISLNATIAIFITAGKSLALLVIGACIAQSKWIRFKSPARRLEELDLFDNAARGPLGSLLLLSNIHWKLGISSIGAIATILALGVDTFAQQVIKLDTRHVEVVDGGASFRLSHKYDGGARWRSVNMMDVRPRSVDIAMEGAVFRGLYNISTIPKFECNSSCVWNGSYISLGFSSQCRNVTEATLMSNPRITQKLLFDSDEIYEMRTPKNVPVWTVINRFYRTGVNVNATTPVIQNTTRTRAVNAPAESVRIAVARRHPYLKEPTVIEDETDFSTELEIMECSIGFAAYNYTAINATGNRIATDSSIIALEPGVLSPNRSDTSGLLFNQTGLPAFWVKEADLKALINVFISSRFSGNMLAGRAANKPGEGVTMALATADITATFENMAASMTEELRSRGTMTANGITITEVVFVRIEWAWLALPIAVTLTAAGFLLATWLENRAHGCIPWKSSSVALLYHDVVAMGESTAILRSNFNGLEEMENAAKITKAVLE